MDETPGDTQKGDLSVTALYTSYTWYWGRLPCAELLKAPGARLVFLITNIALVIAKIFIWGMRSLRHSLLHRHTMIDHLLRKSGVDQVLEVAAGLSRRGAAFSENPELLYTEVDLPQVVSLKAELLKRTPEGRAVLKRENYRLLERDVTEMELSDLVETERPLFIIAEGLFMYLKAQDQRALWERMAELLRMCPDGSFIFDLVPVVEQPRPGIVGRLLGWLMKRFTGGRTFERDQRTRDDIVEELKTVGFSKVTTLEPQQVAQEWTLPYPNRKTQQLLFLCQLSEPSETMLLGVLSRGG